VTLSDLDTHMTYSELARQRVGVKSSLMVLSDFENEHKSNCYLQQFIWKKMIERLFENGYDRIKWNERLFLGRHEKIVVCHKTVLIDCILCEPIELLGLNTLSWISIDWTLFHYTVLIFSFSLCSVFLMVNWYWWLVEMIEIYLIDDTTVKSFEQTLNRLDNTNQSEALSIINTFSGIRIRVSQILTWAQRPKLYWKDLVPRIDGSIRAAGKNRENATARGTSSIPTYFSCTPTPIDGGAIGEQRMRTFRSISIDKSIFRQQQSLYHSRNTNRRQAP
jgi:hypothetical protein